MTAATHEHGPRVSRRSVLTGSALAGIAALGVGVAWATEGSRRPQAVLPPDNPERPGANPGNNPPSRQSSAPEQQDIPDQPLDYCAYLLDHPEVQASILAVLPGATVSPDQCIQPDDDYPHAVASFNDGLSQLTLQVAPANTMDWGDPNLEERTIEGAGAAYVSTIPNHAYVAMSKDPTNGFAVILSYSPEGGASPAHVESAVSIAEEIATNRF